MSKKLRIIIIVAVVIFIAVMIFVNLKKSRGATTEVTTTKVERGNITKTVSGSGYIQPETDVQIAARISAEIIKIHVEEGDHIEKGQLLVELDRQSYEAFVEQRESQVLSAKASLKKAEADYSRTKNLFDQKLSSQADLDAAEANKLLAQSQVQQARASLKQAQDDLAKTRIMAPMKGTVTKLDKEEGEIAVGSTFSADPIMTVSDLNFMEVLAEIDENDVVLVTIGDSSKIEVDAIQDTMFDGRVSEIAHTATTRGRGTQEQVTNFEVKIAVTSDVERLRPGMSATVDIFTETHEDILFIPIQCVTVREIDSSSDSTTVAKKDQDSTRTDNDKPASEKERKEVVFVVKDGVATVVPVETGISDDTNIEILSGLEEGQTIVSGSYKVLSKDLKDGDKVKVQGDGPKENDKEKK